MSNASNGFPQVIEKVRDLWALQKAIVWKLVNETMKITHAVPPFPLGPWMVGIDLLEWMLPIHHLKAWTYLLDCKQFAN